METIQLEVVDVPQGVPLRKSSSKSHIHARRLQSHPSCFSLDAEDLARQLKWMHFPSISSATLDADCRLMVPPMSVIILSYRIEFRLRYPQVRPRKTYQSHTTEIWDYLSTHQVLSLRLLLLLPTWPVPTSRAGDRTIIKEKLQLLTSTNSNSILQ